MPRRVKDHVSEVAKTDVVLVGAGIMSATLATLLKLMEPDWSITLVERLDGAAAESSDPWNNAGTGHSALCELNYTPQRADGTIEISKAVHVNEQFQVSRQFWAHAVESGVLPDVRSFLNPIPHVSFVHGAKHLDYLKRRRETLVANPLFASMEYIDSTRRVRAPAAADGRQARLLRAGGAELDAGRHRRQLRFADPSADRLRRRRRHDDPVRARGARPRQGVRRQLDAEGHQPAHPSEAQAQRQVRLRRRGRRRPAAAAEVGHRGGQGLRRLPGRRPVAAHREPRAGRRPPGQGLRRTAARRAADVGAALGHPRDQRPVLPAVRSVRGMVAEVPQAGQGHRSAALGQAQQPGLDARRRPHRDEPGQVPGRSAARSARPIGSRRCANSRPAHRIPTGNSTSPVSACR